MNFLPVPSHYGSRENVYQYKEDILMTINSDRLFNFSYAKSLDENENYVCPVSFTDAEFNLSHMLSLFKKSDPNKDRGMLHSFPYTRKDFNKLDKNKKDCYKNTCIMYFGGSFSNGINNKGEFIYNYRSKGTVKTRSMLVLDCENKKNPETMKDFRNRLKRLDEKNIYYFFHKTISYTEENPRYRLLIPFSRNIECDSSGKFNIEEYDIVAKYIKNLLGKDILDVGVLNNIAQASYVIPYFQTEEDRNKYEAGFEESKNTSFLDIDEIINENNLNLKTQDAIKPNKKKSETEHKNEYTGDKTDNSAVVSDPYEKPGIIGAFIRHFSDIRDVLDTVLKDYYTKENDGKRYRYTASQNRGGLLVSDNLKTVYSFSDTDPIGKSDNNNLKHAYNAYDLVRVHKFLLKNNNNLSDSELSELLEKEYTPNSDSCKAMNEWISENYPEIISENEKADTYSDNVGKEIKIKVHGKETKILKSCEALDIEKFIMNNYYEDYLYSHINKSWYKWTGKVWKKTFIRDVQGDVLSPFIEDIKKSGIINKELKKMTDKYTDPAKMTATNKIFSNSGQLNFDNSNFDDQNLLFVANGVLDLRNGKLMPFDKKYRQTGYIDIEYDENFIFSDYKYSLFIKALNTWSNGNKEWVNCLQTILGYSLTGLNSVKKMFVLYDTEGNTGKSTLFNIIHGVIGDNLFGTASSGAFKEGRSGTNTEYAYKNIYNKRIIVASEWKSNDKFNVTVLKNWTGKDQQVGRGLGENEFNFIPKGSLFFLTNEIPYFSQNDKAFINRLVLIPFENPISEKDTNRNLADEIIKKEKSLVFHWLVEGAVKFNKTGELKIPEKWKHNLEEEIQARDYLLEFIKEYLLLQNSDTKDRISHSYVHNCHLKEVFKHFCNTRLEYKITVSDKTFLTELKHKMAEIMNKNDWHVKKDDISYKSNGVRGIKFWAFNESSIKNRFYFEGKEIASNEKDFIHPDNLLL